MIRRLLRTALALAIAFAGTPALLHATGDYFEEPLTTLSDRLKLDQLPAKTIEQIHAELSKPIPKAEKVDMEKEVAGFKTMAPAQAVARIDQLVLQARATQDTPALNLLNDLRDLHAGPANAPEIADYLAWRTAKPTYETDEIQARLDKAAPALLPHFLYLRAAAFYHDQDFKQSQALFEKILTDFPQHPRAEVALFMDARNELARSRSGEDNDPPPDGPVHRTQCKKRLDQYMAKYPKGRFAGDALGWLGGWYWDGNDLYQALKCYLGQLDYPDHPELAATAIKMCERILSFSASEPNEEDWAAIAKHPMAGQALVYLVLNTAEANNYDGKLDPVDEVKAWRKKVLPQIAAAIAGQEALYKDAVWRPRFLSALALAASGTGNQEEALKLLDTAGEATDDLLLARGVVLQRTKRQPEAITAFRTLLEKFPSSALARRTRLRLGLALADDHQAGQAVLELDPLLEKVPGAVPPPSMQEVYAETGAYPIYTDVPDDEVRQLTDVWLNAAPIEELAGPALAAGLDPVKRLRLTEPIAERLLAREQFEEAKKYLTAAQYHLFAGPIEKLTLAARAAKGPARAAACLALGDAWAAARGKLLTYRLDSASYRKAAYPREDQNANARRATAAELLGYEGNIRLDLENRDELRHAFNWWLEASDAKGDTKTTAAALWHALHAMPLIADVSPFTFERAVSRKWGDVARKLYDRLHTECPNSVEARRYAVTWNFSFSENRKGEEPMDDASRGFFGEPYPTLETFKMEESIGSEEADEKRDLKALLEDPTTAEFKQRIEKLQSVARGKFVDLYDSRWVNFYDDLALFLSEPAATGDVRRRYVQMRVRFLERSAVGSFGSYLDGSETSPDPDTALQKDIAAALTDASMKPVADYLEFLNLAVIANRFTFVPKNNVPKTKAAEVLDQKNDDTYRTHDYPLLARKVREFLVKYPQSKKREAALLLEARAVFRASEAVPLHNLATWPQAPRWEGGYLDQTNSQEPFDAKRVRAALDAYDRAFPHGRYSGDTRDYRAALALRLHDWKPALEMTLEQMQDTNRFDLQAAAGRRLGVLFDQLADERYRADLLPAIKTNPRGRERLLQYIGDHNDIHPLFYLTAWLQEQLAVPAPPSSAKP